MIAKCKVIINNGVNMVVDFNGKELQMPSVKTKDKIVFVKCENEKYTVVDKNEYEKSLVKYVKKPAVKAKEEVIESENEE